MAVSLGILSVLRRLARVEGRWCDFAISCAIFLESNAKVGELDLVCSSTGLEGKPSIREVGAGEFFCAGRKWGHRARQ